MTTVYVAFEHPDKQEAAKLARWVRRRGRKSYYGAESHHFRVTVSIDDAQPDRLAAAKTGIGLVATLLASYSEWRPTWITVRS